MDEHQPDAMVGKLLGSYRLDRRLGRGGMGEVYLAHDTSLDRPVAVKFLLPTHAQSEIVVRRFQREARAAARISHPNIVQIHAVGEVEGRPYIVMEYVDGAPLDEMLRHHEHLTWQRALSICGQVASALEHAHAAGIIHRDIKPANILIDRHGRVRVSDFGVAKLAEVGTQLTSDGMFIGTPQYMSPEQCGVGTVGPQSDLFSLGATVYEMVAGTVPFRANTPAALIRKITLEDAPPIHDLVPELPEGVCAVIDRMLVRDPDARYPNATELLLDLHRLKDNTGETISSTRARKSMVRSPARAAAQRREWFTPRNAAIAAIAVLVIMTVLAAIGHYRRNKQAERDLNDAVESFAGAPAAAGPQAAESPIAPSGSGPRLQSSAKRLDPAQTFRRFDANADRRLDRNEFPEKLRDRFQDFDTNKNGQVDETEFLNGLRQFRRSFQPPGQPPPRPR